MSSAPLRLLGTLAIQQGILRVDQILPLLEEQARDVDVPFGELARRRGLLSARQIRYLLDLQRSVKVDPAETAFGTLALQNGFVSPEDVIKALDAQRAAPAPLGEILLDMGALAPQQRGALLSAQKRLRGGGEGELDYETRLLPAVAEPGPAPGQRPEPQGWLIQETGDDLGRLFPLGESSVLGRLADQDVPVPDLAASRDHAVIEYVPALLQHVIRDLDSRNGTFVNGAQIIRPRPLQPGDRVQVGSTLLRYVTGGGIGGGRGTLVSRLGEDARRVASKAIPLLRDAATAASDTAHRLLATHRHKTERLAERRDSLLEQLGLAAVETDPESTAAFTAKLAERRLEESRRGGDPSAVRWAERRRIEALRELGRRVVSRGPAPEGWMRVVVEIRQIDAELCPVKTS